MDRDSEAAVDAVLARFAKEAALLWRAATLRRQAIPEERHEAIAHACHQRIDVLIAQAQIMACPFLGIGREHQRPLRARPREAEVSKTADAKRIGKSLHGVAERRRLGRTLEAVDEGLESRNHGPPRRRSL